jgi:8-amino-7-oxononanoate synthase
LQDLEDKLRHHRELFAGSIFVVTETIFSMDGHLAPVVQLVQLCEKYRAHLIIDEAHAIGVIGERGEGLVQSCGLHERVFARIYTYGKGPGCHGAAVTGSARLKSFLVNFSRSFIFTTALPDSAVRAISAAYRVFPNMSKERARLQENIQQFKDAALPFEKLNSSTPVQGILIPGNIAVKSMSARLAEQGLDVRPILYPSVPKGLERLRISMHSFNTEEEMAGLLRGLAH